MTFERPAIGRWYSETETGALFEVVARDESAGTVEIQYLDGAIAEFDTESWREMALQPAVEPEDWRSSFELADEDRIDSDMPMHPDSGSDPLGTIEPISTWEAEEY